MSKKSKDKASSKSKRKKSSADASRAATAPAPAAYLARVYVSLKPTVNDPEGNTIAGALTSLGFPGVEAVRSGRYFQLRLGPRARQEADAAIDQMCARLLANPVIETYRYELEALQS